jgi:archaeosine synthase beta-subunit
MDLNPPYSQARIRALRPPKSPRDPRAHQGALVEPEPDGLGGLVLTATYFLTGSECRFTCSMCDLWQYTIDGSTPQGSLPHQVRSLHTQLGSSTSSIRWLKLYNAANFFDVANVPADDLDSLADLCNPYDRIVVENHAALFQSPKIRERVLRFAARLRGKLEVAMGLESIDPAAMRWLNKSQSLTQFERACAFLQSHGITTRAFVLLQPPGTHSDTSVDWCIASCRAAYAWGVRSCSVIPTRPGPGLLQNLQSQGLWSPPTVGQLECVMDAVLREIQATPLGDSQHPMESKTLVSDLWDWERVLGACATCRVHRHNRLIHINQLQRPLPRWQCTACDQKD